MKITDLMGSPLEIGDIVCIRPDHVVGQVISVDSGEIARGVSISGQPQGEMPIPKVVISIAMTSAVIPHPNGQCPGLVKVARPAEQKVALDEKS